MEQKKRKRSVPVISSLKTKIVVMVILAIFATSFISMITIAPSMRDEMLAITLNYLEDISLITGEGIERDVEKLGAEEVLTPEKMERTVKDVKVKGLDSSYAYVVDADGVMIYHPTAEKIGKPVENTVVMGIVQEIAAGRQPQNGIVKYEYRGVVKYAACYTGKNRDFIVVVSADEDEASGSVREVLLRCGLSNFLTLILCMVITTVIAFIIVRPIERVTGVVAKLAELDFRKDENLNSVTRRRDESGVMGRAIETLQEQLACVTGQITEQSKALYEASNVMNTSAQETTASVDQVERAISEIAEGATAQAQETQTATENIIVMGNMIEETNVEVENLRVNARAMRDAGNKAMDILEELNAINQQTKEAIQVISTQTNTTNESALKIKEAADMISDIAEETNLLSLNASIEAARAGEQGRGFAVVAAQIQKLAEQSNESASQIAEIINLLITESEKSVETMEDVKVVIEKQDENVVHTENAFKDVKVGIDKSIDVIRIIAAKTKQLDEARVRVVDVVQNLTSIAEENAASTEETSASAVEVGAIMSGISDNAKHLNEIADEMEASIKVFKTE